MEHLDMVQCGASRMNLSVGAMMRLQFGVGWLWCEIRVKGFSIADVEPNM